MGSRSEGRMPQHLDLIFTLTGAFAAAVVFGLVTQRLRLSPIVGYLIADAVGRSRPASWRTPRSPSSWPRSASSC